MYNHMLVLVLIDHRWAFLMLAVLLIAAAIPLACAWARLLPEEPPPFPIEPGAFPTIDQELPPETPSRRRRDLLISFALLVCITLTYLIRFPGFPSSALTRWLGGVVSGPTAYWTIFSSRVFLIGAAGAAIVYAAFRPGPLRIPLLSAAALVLALWFLAPLLKTALLSAQ
jgi:hypothetical protein